MSININNYEEFFMLYADNELSERERQQVEEFLSDHPDYKGEFDLMMSTVMPAPEAGDGIALSLLKLPSGLGAEEAILLEVDGEISAQQLQEIDQLCTEYPQLIKERELMNSIKLNNDQQLRFEDKSVLYRHESRVISIRMWKPAIAAAIIGVGLFFGLNETNRVDDAELVGVQENGAPVTSNRQEAPALIHPDSFPADVRTNEALVENPVIEQSAVDGNETVSIPSVSKDHKLNKAVKSTPGNSNSKTIESASPVLENINKAGSNYRAYSPVSLERNTEMNMTPPDEIKTDVQRLTASKPLDVNLTVQKNIAGSIASKEAENNSSIGAILIVDEEKVNHSKFGGFVRKVKRTIEKKTNFKMPEEVRVAGFEIAIK
ncbi:MAG: hypothetical protein EOO01_00655 [Chitinophagaceae bacterium]|nr:MAG: hypothetical protein EOO01_00655 [Chitinophagaceae bacterium]